MFNKLKSVNGKSKRKIVTKLVLLDEIDYDLIYSNKQLNEICDEHKITRSSGHNRLHVIKNKFLYGNFNTASLHTVRTFARYSQTVINGFAISVALGVITEEELKREIVMRFIKKNTESDVEPTQY